MIGLGARIDRQNVSDFLTLVTASAQATRRLAKTLIWINARHLNALKLTPASFFQEQGHARYHR